MAGALQQDGHISPRETSPIYLLWEIEPEHLSARCRQLQEDLVPEENRLTIIVIWVFIFNLGDPSAYIISSHYSKRQ